MVKDQDSRLTESRRILDRVAREAEAGGTAFDRAARRARDHVTAADADRNDWAEYWGTRIGRAVALAVTVALLGWLLLYLLGAG